MSIKIFNMDVRKALKLIPDESIDMQICSPPFWGLRDYGKETEVIWDGDENCEHKWEVEVDKGGRIKRKEDYDPKFAKGLKENNPFENKKSNFCSKCNAWKGQLGLEFSFEDYIRHLLQIFDQVKRVLKSEGTCFVNLSDTYSSAMGKHGGTTAGFSEETNVGDEKRPPVLKQVPAKCLCGIPERFMLGMIERNWILRNKICWYKPNHMPSSVNDRFCNSWEYLFFFSKSKHYYFDLDAVREKVNYPENTQSFNIRVRDAQKGRLQEKWGDKYKASEKEISEYDEKNYQTKIPKEQAENFGSPRARDCKYEQKYNQLNDKAFQRQILGIPHDLANCNPLGKNPGDVIEENMKMEAAVRGYSDHSAARTLTHLHQVKEDYSKNPLGKNPSDSWQVQSYLSSKYLQGEGHSNRQGLNRPIDLVTIKAYKEYHQPIANFLKQNIKKEHHKILDEEFGQYKWRHFIRTDFSGASLPGVEDWFKLKEIIGFDDIFDDKIYEIQKLNIPVFQSGRNPSDSWTEYTDDFWSITTQPFKDAHFAVFPEALVEKPIKTTRKDAVILDIFAGSGTTLKAARDLGRDAIGIEIKPEYVEICRKRLFGSKDQQLLFGKEFKIIK